MNRSERQMLITQIEQLNKSLSTATTEEQKTAILEKIASLKKRITQLDSLQAGKQPIVTSEKDMLNQELLRLNELLAKATTEDEKKALMQKIEYTKTKLTSLSSGTSQPRTEITFKSERDMILQQIQDLQKATAAASKEEDKKLFAEKISTLNLRLKQLENSDSIKTTVVKNSFESEEISANIKAIDELIIKKRMDLTVAIQNGQNDKAIQIEREVTSLIEKKKLLEITLSSNNRTDTNDFNRNNDSLSNKDSRIAELKLQYNAQQKLLDSLKMIIAELKVKIEEAEKQNNASELQLLKNRYSLVNEKINNLIVSMEKNRIECEGILAGVQFKEATSELKENTKTTKMESDSLLKILQEKNRTRSELIKKNADPLQIAALTDEMLILKENFLKNQQELVQIRNEINDARAENLLTQKTLQSEKLEVIASENRNERGFYEANIKVPEKDTIIKSNLQIKINTIEKVSGEIEIAEEFIDSAPAGMRGLQAFDITPSVDLLINMEDALIEIPFNPDSIKGTDIQKLAIYHFNVEKGWEPVQGCSVDVKRKVITAVVKHFSVYGLFTELRVPIIHSDKVNLSPLSLATRNISSTITFDFSLPEKSFVQLYIYTLNGMLVAKPLAGMYKEGFYSFNWNGKNSSRTSASMGKYIARLITKDTQITKTFMIIK
jgi:hypothetical protein